jgi:ADP-ribosylglycohydrolase
MLPIIVMTFHKEGLEVTKEKVLEHLRLTHRSKKLDKHAVIFAELFYNLLNGKDLRKCCLRAGNVKKYQVLKNLKAL